MASLPNKIRRADAPLSAVLSQARRVDISANSILPLPDYFRTTVESYTASVRATVEKLSKQLPKGSHVVMMGLADGRVLYETMHARVHPVGAVRGDVTYHSCQ